MSEDTPMIRTPDARLRVFVSSTLGELSAERKAVRSAIEALHLAPVMFELGARPHAPRTLYRAYLDQSDVFVGIYWEKYGWVAPGEAVSGLEDEYLLSSALPRLIYIKRPAPDAEPRLVELLERIRTHDSTSYKSFATPEELSELLVADLATLLAERFDQSRAPRTVPELVDDLTTGVALPAPLTTLIGRDTEVDEVSRMLRLDSVRLVTLTGPGGIGKSRLAIETAELVAADFPGGAVFVDLSSVTDPNQVVPAIAHAIGVRDSGDGPIDAKLATALRHRRLVLVIDNFEQVVSAASVLTNLLAGAPGVKMLVTSRTLLRVGGEFAYEVGPLALPGSESREHIEQSDAVALFVERARAVKPDFEVTDDNAGAISRIVQVLDGVPLALELAAAGIRMVPPRALLARLGRQLPVLVGGVRDLPARQQALRSTIEWSTSMLTAEQLELLSVLGVFAGAFSLDAIEALAADSRLGGEDPMAALSALVDNSLVRQQDRGDRAFFTMLQSVREYALELLERDDRFETLRHCHARYYVALAERAELPLEGADQREWVTLLADEHENLRAAMRFLLDKRDWVTAAAFAWQLYVYWWVGGHLGEVPDWMDEILTSDEPLDDRTRAIALYFTRAIRYWQDREEWIVSALTESAELFRHAGDESGEALARISLALALLSGEVVQTERADDELESSLALFRSAGDRWGEAFALVTLGRVALAQQHLHRALNRFEESLDLAHEQHDALGEAIALHHLGWATLLLGQTEEARTAFEQGLRSSARLGHVEGVAYGLEGLVAIAAVDSEYHRAGELLGAAQTLRDETGLHNAANFAFHELYVDRIRSSEYADEFEASRRRGRVISADAAVAIALDAVAS